MVRWTQLDATFHAPISRNQATWRGTIKRAGGEVQTREGCSLALIANVLVVVDDDDDDAAAAFQKKDRSPWIEYCVQEKEHKKEATFAFVAVSVERTNKQSSHPPPPTTRAVIMALHYVSVHDHPLQEIGRGGWSCDGPGCHNSDGPRYNCSDGCNYDLCQNCVAQFAAAAPIPEASLIVEIGPGPHRVDNHDHSLSLCDRGGWSCDGRCGTSSGDRFRCDSGCDYDLCSSCLVAHMLPAGAPVECPKGLMDDCVRAVKKTEGNIKQVWNYTHTLWVYYVMFARRRRGGWFAWRFDM